MSNKRLIFLSFLFLIIAGTIVLLLINPWTSKPPSKVYRIGLLQMASTVNANMDGFKIGLSELGYKEGENIIYR